MLVKLWFALIICNTDVCQSSDAYIQKREVWITVPAIDSPRLNYYVRSSSAITKLYTPGKH